MSSDGYSSEEEQVRQPKVQSPFSAQEDMFPAFGGVSQQVAPTLNYSSAWASSAAPEEMPEVVVRRKPRRTAEQAQNPAASAPSSVPWGMADVTATRWSGAGPRGFQGLAHDDPYVVIPSGVPPRRAKAASGIASTSARPAAPAPAPAPIPEKRPKQPKRSDEDGFTEVAMRVRPHQESKQQKTSTVKGIGAQTAFAALQSEEASFEQKSNPSKPEPSKKDSKKKQGSKKEKKQQPVQPAPVQKPKQVSESKQKGGSNKSKKSSNKAAVDSYNKKSSSSNQSLNRGIFFGILLALQYGMQPLLTKECIGLGVNKSSIVISQELLKLFITPIVLFAEKGSTGFTQALSTWSIKSTVQVALLPAGIYAVQNWCLFYSAAHMDPLVFNLVNQTKLIWTALFVYLVLAKPQSNMQMLALLMLMVSAVLLTAAPSDQGSSVPTSLWSGIVPNLVAAVLSGLAAALSQYATQSPKLGRSGYVFTMELCVFQLGWYLLKEGSSLTTGESLFEGWGTYTILPILCNALGGIFTGQVVQHLGAVKKTFAVIAALMLTSVFRWLYYANAPLSNNIFIALPLVMVANYIYSNFPAQSQESAKKKKKSS